MVDFTSVHNCRSSKDELTENLMLIHHGTHRIPKHRSILPFIYEARRFTHQQQGRLRSGSCSIFFLHLRTRNVLSKGLSCLTWEENWDRLRWPARTHRNGEFFPVSINKHAGKVALTGGQGLNSTKTAHPVCEIFFPNGVTIRQPGEFSAQTLGQLITIRPIAEVQPDRHKQELLHVERHRHTNQRGIDVQDGDAFIFINKLCKRSSLFIIIIIESRIS